ncbi:hypothetical protein LQZ18_01830 [Lachnospiraceae bacterium ZAX-1]
MNILVVFKVENDLDLVTEKEWSYIQDNTVDISYARRVFSCFDEAALETALYLAETLKKNEKPVHLTALTIVPENEDISSYLCNLYALQYDELVLITCHEDNIDFQPRISAGLIKAFVDKSERKFDAILLGCQNSLNSSREFPLILAEALRLPCVSQVEELTADEQGIFVKYQMDTGIKQGWIVSSAVFSFGNALHAYLRIATLRAKMATAKKQWTTLNPTQLWVLKEQLVAWRVPLCYAYIAHIRNETAISLRMRTKYKKRIYCIQNIYRKY